MSLNILVIPDKFKGTLTAREAAQAIARGWRKVRSEDTLELLPMTDGGDGFGGVMSVLAGARPRRVKTVDAAHRPCVARWWWEPETRTAVIESAAVIGLALLPPGRFHPFALDTYGLGAVIEAAAAQGARRCWIGIGGSATNDGGFGLARALGWTFYDRRGRRIDRWTELDELERLVAPSVRRRPGRVRVAVDVQNLLLGRRGATRVYGPQKGLRPRDFAQAERCLRRLAAVAGKYFGRDQSQIPGAGAAGGLGFGLSAFIGARLESGFEWFAREAGLERRLRPADLVITGEGAIDASTFMGKGVGQVAALCRRHRVPCLVLAGSASLDVGKQRRFTRLRALTELTTVRQATARPAYWLERLAAQVAGDCLGSP